MALPFHVISMMHVRSTKSLSSIFGASDNVNETQAFQALSFFLFSQISCKDEVVMMLVEKPDEGAAGSISFLTNVAKGF